MLRERGPRVTETHTAVRRSQQRSNLHGNSRYSCNGQFPWEMFIHHACIKRRVSVSLVGAVPKVPITVFYRAPKARREKLALDIDTVSDNTLAHSAT